ncbi:MAG: tol-pal system-associated acyl-CoA thioesterase [Alphaproteobacteria bacterium]|nr:tol-pal system-associated acyl-CoA thioesterase [Alphaproteobacteria bacterium]
MTHHSIDIRIYYEDTDAGGVVYHANYLNFGERGRTEFLRHIGHENSHLAREFGTIFVVKHIEIEYVRPAFLDDLLILSTRIEDMKNSSFKMRQTLTKDGGIISDMQVALVCVDANTLKPVRIPDVLRHAFQKFIV